MGYNSKVWGSQGWHFIHYVCLNYPINPTEEDKRNYLSFFESLKYVLPCGICAYNWSEKMEKTPPNLESREALFNWSVDRHNEINAEDGKQILTYDEALEKIRQRSIYVFSDKKFSMEHKKLKKYL